jgi:glycosyltransferase involved in cell wall biosynthesis
MINILYLHAGAEMYGADKVLLELVTRLNKSLFHPIVILPTHGELEIQLKRSKIEVYIVDYPILRRKYFNLKGIFSFFRDYRSSIDEIIKVLNKKKISIIHINTLAVLEGVVLKHRLNAPMVWHVHEILEHPKLVVNFINFLVGTFANRIVAVSEAVKSNLVKSKFINKDKISVIYNGVDNRVFRPGYDIDYLFKELKIPHDSVRVGMIGRVNSWKGQNDFLAAMSPLLNKYNTVYGVMVGGVFSGQEWRLTQLKENVDNDENSRQFRVLNFRTDSAQLYNFFDVFVLPSTNPDPLPTVVLEAMASGKPIIGYNHGGITEMVKDNFNGFLVPLNTTQLSQKIEVLLKDLSLRRKFGANSLTREKKLFSIESYIEKFEELYKRIR